MVQYQYRNIRNSTLSYRVVQSGKESYKVVRSVQSYRNRFVQSTEIYGIVHCRTEFYGVVQSRSCTKSVQSCTEW